MTLTQELLPKTDEKTAKALLAKVDGLLDDARNGRDSLHRTYVEIGLALDEVENTKAWMVRHRSYDSYIKEHCEPKFGKSRTQLYGYRAIAKNLLPSVTKEQLIEMGVSRAMPLAQYTKQKGVPPPDSLIKQALDPKVGVEEFESLIAEATHASTEKGKWHQFSIKAEDAEWKEIERAIGVALALDPLPENTSEPTRRKVALLRMSAEFLATYEQEVNTGNG
jgi:hypothetical protein